MKGDGVRDTCTVNEGGFRGAGVDYHAIGILLDYTVYLRKFYCFEGDSYIFSLIFNGASHQ